MSWVLVLHTLLAIVVHQQQHVASKDPVVEQPHSMQQEICQPGCSWDATRQHCTCRGHMASSCTVATHEKQDCGYFGIQQAECEARSCCWQPAGNAATPWCYVPQELPAKTYTVMSRHDTPGETTLTLQLTEQVLPAYGPDIEQLTVLVESQTPQRLHVKISPAVQQPTAGADNTSTVAGTRDPDAPRWEVPEFLLPRPGSTEFDPAAALYVVDLPQTGEPFQFAVGRSDSSRVATVDADAAQLPHPVFNTSHFSLVFKDQYLELTTSLTPETALYCLGETIHETGQVKLPRDGRTVTLWNYDIGSSNPGINLYGSHPFYLQVDEDGLSSGVFLLNSNGMDIILQQTSLTYRVIGGVLDFYFFMGPQPEAVMQQYQEVIGRPAMPPLWALGFHQCRWGYNTLADVEEVVQNYTAAAIPLEVVWTDIDYMFRFRDFTFDNERFNVQQLRTFVDKLHASGQRWVPITDCGIPHAPDDPAFTSGMEQGVFINDIHGDPYLGQVWPGATHYPSFLAVNRSWPWWQQQLQAMWEQVPYDGMWIDMNEASNFCEGEVCKLPTPAAAAEIMSPPATTAAAAAVRASGAAGRWLWLQQLAQWTPFKQFLQLLQYVVTAAWFPSHTQQPPVSTAAQQHSTSAAEANCDLACEQPSPDNKLSFPPYAISNLQNWVPLGSKTLPVTARHPDGQLEYNAHNLYGLAEAAATYDAMAKIIKKRPFVLSRSTFAGSGRYAAHWTGDNAATWENLVWSVSGLLNSNMWGLALAGADICGFQGDTTEELCARWIAAGAFYTFTRNHNAIYSLPQELYRWPSVAATARKALGMRYSLLPYLYTSFFQAHTQGGTVARPVFFAFPGDAVARDVFEQWMLGHSILISPVLHPATSQLPTYFPAASWYSLWDFSHIRGPITATLDVPLTDVPVHIRGGSIIAMQQPAPTTALVRKSAVKLVVALDQHQQQYGPQQQQKQQQQHVVATEAAAAGSLDGLDAEADEGKSAAAAAIAPAGGAAGGTAGGTAAGAADGAAGGTAGGTAGSSTDRSGVQLGCGMLYLDDGDTLEVPPIGRDQSLLVFFTSMSLPATLNGWLTTTPAGAADDSKLLQQGSDVFDSCQHQGYRDYYLSAASDSGASRDHAGMAGLHVPQLGEVVVLGLQAPPCGAGYMVSVNGRGQLSPNQVAYDANMQVLHVTGLAINLAEEFKIDWQPGACS